MFVWKQISKPVIHFLKCTLIIFLAQSVHILWFNLQCTHSVCIIIPCKSMASCSRGVLCLSGARRNNGNGGNGGNDGKMIIIIIDYVGDG